MYNVGTFIEWFIGQVVNLITYGVYYLSNIELTENVNLWQFIVAIILTEIFIGLIIAHPFHLVYGEERKDVQERDNRK